MARWMRRIGVILWVVVGCIGIGALVAQLWLARALDSTAHVRPTLQFIDRGNAGNRSCVSIVATPASMDVFGARLRASGTTDLRTFARSVFRCGDDAERQAFVAMLRRAATKGDTIASRALDALVQASCEDLAMFAGHRAHDDGAVASSCAIVGVAVQQAVASNEQADRTRTVRFAAQLALIDAEVLMGDVLDQFCADADGIPVAQFERLARAYSGLRERVASLCAPAGASTPNAHP